MKTTRFLKSGVRFLSGMVFLMTTMSSCSKADVSNPASNDDTQTKESILDYSFSDNTANTGTCCIDSLPYESLSTEETDALTFLREEELLAHDVYIALSQLYTKPIFVNISKSETKHTEAIQSLLVKYGLTDPAANHTLGHFSNPDLQALYNALITQGSSSLLNGLIVGATIEDLDIHDLKTHLLSVDNQDITFVFNNLMRGSRNHLRSFYANILFHGGSYVPQYLTQDEFDAIISSKHETGQGNCICL